MSAQHLSAWLDKDLSIFRDSVGRLVAAEMDPNDQQWR
jgi:hypothetical protein